jgi:hypothetical protein
MLQTIIEQLNTIVAQDVVMTTFLVLTAWRVLIILVRDMAYRYEQTEKKLAEIEFANRHLLATMEQKMALPKQMEFDPSKGRKTVKLIEPNTARM